MKYRKLTELILRKNEIKKIAVETFQDLKNLTRLDISDNQLQNISEKLKPGMFKENQNLKILEIQRNMLWNLSSLRGKYIYPDSVLSEPKHLSNLYMDIVANPVFGEQFKKLSKLKVLMFSHCRIVNMTNSTLQNFPESVKELHMNSCFHITSIEYGFLRPFTALKVINFANSAIHITRALLLLAPFSNGNMDVINFQHVSRRSHDSEEISFTTIITRKEMKYLRTICVKTLNLADNGIIDFRKGSLLTYDHPECFEYLVLSANRISFETLRKEVEIQTLKVKAVNLLVFDLSFDPFRSHHETLLKIPNGAVDNHLSYETCDHQSRKFEVQFPVKLMIARLSNFYIDGCGNSINITSAPSLEVLDLSYSDFQDFQSVIISGGNKIKTLNLSGIGPTLMNELQMLALSSVETLDISHNTIVSLPVDVFGSYSKISFLDLSYNLFHEVPTAVMKLRGLQKLNLEYNNIVSLPEFFMQWLDELTPMNSIQIMLRGNLFNCDCNHRSFIKWTIKTRSVRDKNLQCLLSNDYLQDINTTYLNYHQLFVNCDAKVWIQVGAGLVVGFSVITLIVAIVFNFRWRIA